MLPLLIAGAGIGAALGGWSTVSRSDKEREKIKQQRQMAEDAYGYKRAYSEAAFNLEKTQSLENLGIQSNRLAESFGMNLEGFNLGLEGEALQNQAAKLSLADSSGMALAQEGASGVRGSDTLKRRIGYQEKLSGKREEIRALKKQKKDEVSHAKKQGQLEVAWKWAEEREKLAKKEAEMKQRVSDRKAAAAYLAACRKAAAWIMSSDRIGMNIWVRQRELIVL